jgi:pimeloyl-ACP methyl ester carboxylesterase
MHNAYVPRRPAQSQFIPVRGLRYHLQTWGDPSLVTPERPALVMVHGWMDVGASFQFVVDALAARDEAQGFARYIIAPDWRGFGLSDNCGSDSYWFPDYVGDLDGLLNALLPGQTIDLLGHSMGGNVVMAYAGVRPQRIRRLVNLEGFGLPAGKPQHAPKRLVQWLDELQTLQTLRSYATLDGVAERLMKNNPLLPADKAVWLAPHWARHRTGEGEDGQWHILGDPAHKRANPVVYRAEEHIEMWKAIRAPVFWAEGDRTDMAKWWGDRYPRAEFEARLAVVPNLQRALLSPCGHMLHHDQPEALAGHLAPFLA